MDEELNQLKLSIKNFSCSSAVNLPYIDVYYFKPYEGCFGKIMGFAFRKF